MHYSKRILHGTGNKWYYLRTECKVSSAVNTGRLMFKALHGLRCGAHDPDPEHRPPSKPIGWYEASPALLCEKSPVTVFPESLAYKDPSRNPQRLCCAHTWGLTKSRFLRFNKGDISSQLFCFLYKDILVRRVSCCSCCCFCLQPFQAFGDALSSKLTLATTTNYGATISFVFVETLSLFIDRWSESRQSKHWTQCASF